MPNSDPEEYIRGKKVRDIFGLRSNSLTSKYGIETAYIIKQVCEKKNLSLVFGVERKLYEAKLLRICWNMSYQ